MLNEYLPILVLVILAIILALLIVLVASYAHRLIGARKEIPGKYTPYESGIRPIGSARRRVPVRFYLVAMLFILFDIEVVFFYPWAITFGTLRNAGMHSWLPFMLGEVLVFIAILLVGYGYIWKKGAFNWD